MSVLNFSIMLSHLFLKDRRDFKLKYVLIYVAFLCLFFYLSFKHKIIYNDVKLCHQIEVFTPEYLNAKNKLHEASVSSQFILLTISKLKQINNKSFYRLLIILLGEISLNPGPVCRYQLLNTSFSKQKVCI